MPAYWLYALQDGRTALHLAAQSGSFDVVLPLGENGTSVDSKGKVRERTAKRAVILAVKASM